jgi:DNA-binding MarR family transcriptional regulator
MHYGTIDTEYLILENIYDSGVQKTVLRQRDLAQITGTSLGMTNAIIRRLAQKGWISIKKLNRRNIQYAVTLEGINEIIHRSYSYFKRTIKNAVYYKDALDGIIYRALEKNISTVALIGSSDLDFIVEHICHRHNINFLKALEPEIIKREKTRNILTIYSENISDSKKNDENSFYLSDLVLKQTKELR